MKPFIILLLSFLIALFIVKLKSQTYNYILAANIAMASMLVFTAIGHFVFTEGMTHMIPKAIPFKKEIILLTGFLELILALGLLFNKTRLLAGWILIIFLVIILPSNVYATSKNLNYQNGTLDGYGLSYLWFRIPLQFFFIFWVYISSIKKW